MLFVKVKCDKKLTCRFKQKGFHLDDGEEDDGSYGLDCKFIDIYGIKFH